MDHAPLVGEVERSGRFDRQPHDTMNMLRIQDRGSVGVSDATGERGGGAVGDRGRPLGPGWLAGLAPAMEAGYLIAPAMEAGVLTRRSVLPGLGSFLGPRAVRARRRHFFRDRSRKGRRGS
ncbi:MAG TPA: hypothetical protein VMR25_27925 [Planctomycetaceae bacterium]|jgi:hypothetical protein|nr:hypothetical protein [Planctomycetaceae bacterium]